MSNKARLENIMTWVVKNRSIVSIYSLNVFKVEIYILKQILRIDTDFVLMLPEM